MKEQSHSDMHEGSQAFDRFRKAVKAIIGVPKSVVTQDRKRTASKRSTDAKTKSR